MVKFTYRLSIDDRNSECKAPGFGPRVGNLIGHAIQVKQGRGLRRNNNEEYQEATQFQTIFKIEWGCQVNNPYDKQLKIKKQEKDVALPLTDELKKLHQYLIR